MNANTPATADDWIDPDDAPELTDELMEIAEFAVGHALVLDPADDAIVADAVALIR